MIGVICAPDEVAAVREFFELFKTPWEMAEPDTAYDAVIASGECDEDRLDARLVIRFRRRPAPGGQRGVGSSERPTVASIDGTEVPLYHGAARPIMSVSHSNGTRVIRCGYDLFGEAAFLLTQGQPAEHAATATLDRHIALIRRWLVEAGIEVVELPPTPPGCDLLATLTHDIDFLGIRRHTRDRTLVGFLYRASVGSVVDLVHGRKSVGQVLRNWLAIASLPFVYAGALEDFWLPFERYVQADSPARSTFFIVPFRDRPGTGPDGRVDPARGVPYGAREIAAELQRLAAQGHEIAVHGIEAWRDAGLGRAELTEVSDACGGGELGVRMHWLYLDEGSFAALDRAGFAYDATFGYNETIGFRAGTAQVFAPLGTDHLLELPLHIQDTALLYPTRMHLRAGEALRVCEDILGEVSAHGGVATISWHERSLSPERLWDRVYGGVQAQLRARRADTRTARDVVAWFRARRGVTLEGARLDASTVDALVTADGDPAALRVRVHRAGGHTDRAIAASDLVTAVREPRPVGS